MFININMSLLSALNVNYVGWIIMKKMIPNI